MFTCKRHFRQCSFCQRLGVAVVGKVANLHTIVARRLRLPRNVSSATLLFTVKLWRWRGPRWTAWRSVSSELRVRPDVRSFSWDTAVRLPRSAVLSPAPWSAALRRRNVCDVRRSPLSRVRGRSGARTGSRDAPITARQTPCALFAELISTTH